MYRKLSHLLVAAVISLSAVTVASSCSTSKAVSAEQARNDSIANVVASRLIDGKAFMLTADQISAGTGRTISVTNNTNFIIIEGDQAIIQFSPGIGGGPNGVGGFTFKGDVSSYSVRHSGNGDTMLQFHFNSNAMAGDVSMTLYKHSTRASAYISSTFYRGKAQMWGNIVPLGATQVIEGQSR